MIESYYDTLPDRRPCLVLHGTGYLTLPLTWDYSGPVVLEYEAYVEAADVRESMVLHYGLAGANRFSVCSPWADGMLYADYGASSADKRIATPFETGRWVNVRIESGGSLNTERKLYLNGRLAAQASGSGGPTASLSTLYVGVYNPNGLTANMRYFKGWLRNIKAWQGTTLVLNLPFYDDLQDKVSGQYASGTGFGLTTK